MEKVTFCERFNCRLYHPVDTSLICDHRALRLSECRACRGIEGASKIKGTASNGPIPKLITLNVIRGEWVKAVREIRQEYNIREGEKQDETSARRVAILIGELYLSQFRGSLSKVPIVERDCFDLAMEYRLKCDSLEREERVKREARKKVLYVSGIDKASGMEGYTTQLKEWAAVALLVKPEKEVIENGELSTARNGYRRRTHEGPEYEEIRASVFKGRERDALRSIEQDQSGLS